MSSVHLHSLDIGDCDLTDESVSVIKDIIHRKEHPKGLNELIISCNSKITSSGWSNILLAVIHHNLEKKICYILIYVSIGRSCSRSQIPSY